MLAIELPIFSFVLLPSRKLASDSDS